MINCMFENGNKALLRHVTVGAIAVNDKNQVLLVKRAPHLINGNKYAVPGGFLDRDEDTAKGTLRELFEETGLKGEIKFIFRINDSKRRKEDRQNVDFLFIVKVTGGEIKKTEEGSGSYWFDESDLPPEEEFAFDHRDSIIRYFEYLKSPFNLPILG